MSTTKEGLLIQIDEKGARVVKRNISEIGKASTGATSQINMMKKALGGLAVALSVRNLIQIADTYTVIQNRLGVVTSSTKELSDVTKSLFKISIDTRSSFENTAEVYTRAALAARQLGIEQRQVADFAKSLNQAIILSGAGAQEARNGMIQLAQALSSGKLHGDELRAVLEQLPLVADVIAQELGVTRGELRKLGETGEITAAKIFQAFKNARVELNEKFGKTIPTIGQSMEVLRTRFIGFVADLNEATGASRFLAVSILALSQHLDLLAVAILAVGAAYAVASGHTVLTVFAKLTGALKSARLAALGLSAAMGPLLTSFGLFGVAAVAMYSFKDSIKVTEDGVVTLGDVWDIFVKDFNAGMDQIRGAMPKAVGADETEQEVIKVKSAAEKFFLFFANAADVSAAPIKALEDTVRALVDASVVELAFDLNIPGESETSTLFSRLGAVAVDAWNASWDRATATQEYVTKAFERATDTARGVVGDDHEFAEPKLSGAEIKAREKAYNMLMRTIYTVDAANAKLSKGITVIDKNFMAGGLSVEEYNDAMRAFMESLEDTIHPMEALNRELEREIKLAKMASNEREIEQRVMERVLKAKKLNVDFDAEAQASLRKQVTLLQEANVETEVRADFLEQLNGKTNEMAAATKIANELLKDPAYANRAEDIEALLDAYRPEKITTYGGAIAELNKEIDQQFRVLKLTNKEQEISNQLHSIGLALSNEFTDDQRADLELLKARLIGLQDLTVETAMYRNVLESVNGPMDDFRLASIAVEKLLEDQVITTDEAAEALEGYKLRALETQTDLISSLEAQSIRIGKMAGDMGTMIGDVVSGMYNQMGGALHDFLMTGKMDFKAFAREMISMILKIIIQMMVMKAIEATLGGLSGMFGGGTSPQGPNVGAGGAGASMGARSKPRGFAQGGDFTVPGNGATGTDGAMVAFRATPGERVSVSRPNQPGAPGSSGQSTPEYTPTFNIINVTSPEEALDMIDSEAGHRTILNVLEQNSFAVRNIASNGVG